MPRIWTFTRVYETAENFMFRGRWSIERDMSFAGRSAKPVRVIRIAWFGLARDRSRSNSVRSSCVHFRQFSPFVLCYDDQVFFKEIDRIRIGNSIRLSGKFLSSHKVIVDEREFLFYIFFIELGMMHFVLFLLLCLCIIW